MIEIVAGLLAWLTLLVFAAALAAGPHSGSDVRVVQFRDALRELAGRRRRNPR